MRRSPPETRRSHAGVHEAVAGVLQRGVAEEQVTGRVHRLPGRVDVGQGATVTLRHRTGQVTSGQVRAGQSRAEQSRQDGSRTPTRQNS